MVTNVLNIITAVVTGIAAISLLVGAIGILTIMWIVVQERVAEDQGPGAPGAVARGERSRQRSHQRTQRRAQQCVR